MDTYLTGGIEEVISVQGLFKIFTLHHDLIPLLISTEDFSLHCSFYLSSIHHPLAGDADQKQLIRLESFFKKEGSDRTGITPFDNKAHLEAVKFMDVGG